MRSRKVSRRLLVAEDNPVGRMVIRHQLERLGHDVDVVGNGRQALDALGRTRYGLVLMDCQMPELDGYETTRCLRRAGESLPVIAFTAQAESRVGEACHTAGMDGFLAKPAAMRELRSLLDVWLPAGEAEMNAEKRKGGRGRRSCRRYRTLRPSSRS